MAQKAQLLVQEAAKLFEGNNADGSLEKLQLAKREIVQFSSNTMFVQQNQGNVALERQVTIQSLELGTFIAIKLKDLDLFDRHVTQLKTFYTNFPELAVQGNASCLLGLNLLHLLASDRRGEFHQELELIPSSLRNQKHIEHPVLLERYLMEGNYSKILNVTSQLESIYKEVPKQAGISQFFGERLQSTVRNRVAESMEKSYKSIPVNAAIKMLALQSAGDLQTFAKNENDRKKREEEEDINMGDSTPGLMKLAELCIRWSVQGDLLCFTSDTEKQLEVPAMTIIGNTIGYATDLERIV